jgi:hypothetical protein
VFRKDAFWDSVLSDDTDCLDSDEDSTRGYGDIDERVGNDEDVEVKGDDTDEHVGNDEDGDGDGNEDGDGDNAVNVGEGDADGNDRHHRSGEEIEESGSSSYMDESDELRSPSDSGDDSAVPPEGM